VNAKQEVKNLRLRWYIDFIHSMPND